MRKIVLCGATHGTNFGDTMFGLMFYEHIKDRYPGIAIYFTKVSEYFKKCESECKEYKQTWNDIDGFIYISGGFFGDSPNEKFKNRYFRFMNYIRYGLMAKRKNIPIAVIGVGTGPIKNVVLRRMVISLCNYAQAISVRDIQSYQFLKKNGCENEINVTSDLAQSIGRKEFQNWFCNQETNILKKKKKILVHCPTAVIQEYKDKIIQTVDELYKNDESVEVYFCNDSLEGKQNLNEMVGAYMGKNKKIYSYEDPLDFIRFLRKMDFIITPKLHVGIFSATFGKAVISFPIHPGKTTRYYQQIGYPERSIPLSEVSREQVSRMINQFMNNPIRLPKKIYEKSEENFAIMDRFIEKYIEYQEDKRND